MHPLETTHSASSCVPATPSAIYDALLDPQALAQWLAPDGATCRIDRLEPWVGGRFRMVLSFAAQPGKSGAFTDEVNGHFVELQPGARVVQAITFESRGRRGGHPRDHRRRERAAGHFAAGP
jgi:uncharacterized protein YndB with AHSA1/START domain